MSSISTTKRCKKGYIKRKSYKTKRGKYVSSSCIKDRGLPGKGPRNFTLKKRGDLTRHGYSLKLNEEQRRNALKKAKNSIAHATLIRKINALSILMKNTNPTYSKRARSDVKWLSSTK